MKCLLPAVLLQTYLTPVVKQKGEKPDCVHCPKNTAKATSTAK